MILYCIRHGESVYNAEGRIQGQADVPLSERGVRQGQAVAEALGRFPIEAIYSSPLQRALATARMIAEPRGLAVRTDPRLMEINAGIFQHRLSSELVRLYPEPFARWSSGDPDYVIPGGESRAALRGRGLAAFQAIRAAGHRQAAVVAHGRLLVVTLQALVPIPEDRLADALHNGSITTIAFGEDGVAELLGLDRTDHLDGIGPCGDGDL
ncbi:MAG TPA: histidine phosphatase family protein [Planctomycetes bacterium]|nr:histidine phosphatase family protein [Planctomycetota bacterium]